MSLNSNLSLMIPMRLLILEKHLSLYPSQYHFPTLSLSQSQNLIPRPTALPIQSLSFRCPSRPNSRFRSRSQRSHCSPSHSTNRCFQNCLNRSSPRCCCRCFLNLRWRPTQMFPFQLQNCHHPNLTLDSRLLLFVSSICFF